MSLLRGLPSRAAAQSSPIANIFRQTTNVRPFHTSAARMVVHNVHTSGEFKAAIADNPKVIVDAFATWCGPCKAIAPKLAELSEDEAVKDKVHFIKLDVDELPDVAKDLGIRAMPTFLLFENGEKSDEMVGADPTALISKVKAFAG